MSYLLDNAAQETGGRFAGLAACYDQATFRYLSRWGWGKPGGAGSSAPEAGRWPAGWGYRSANRGQCSPPTSISTGSTPTCRSRSSSAATM